jgi:DNA-binding transcriptional ArsR family regulator
MSYQRVLDALGDPTRRRILEQLRDGPRPVGEIAAALPVSRPAVSRHLRVLEGAGLVRHSARGTRNLYAVAPQGLTELQRWMVALWDDALAGLAEHLAGHDDGGTT